MCSLVLVRRSNKLLGFSCSRIYVSLIIINKSGCVVVCTAIIVEYIWLELLVHPPKLKG